MLLCLLPCLGGCAQTLKYRELDAPHNTFGDIWRGLQHLTRQLGYRADRNHTDRGKRVFQSTWNTTYKSPRGTTRYRLRAEVERIEPGEPGWRVRCYVEKQQVATIGRSLNPREEDWEAAGQDLHREKRFVRHLRGQLGIKADSSRPTGDQPTRSR